MDCLKVDGNSDRHNRGISHERDRWSHFRHPYQEQHFTDLPAIQCTLIGHCDRGLAGARANSPQRCVTLFTTIVRASG